MENDEQNELLWVVCLSSSDYDILHRRSAFYWKDDTCSVLKNLSFDTEDEGSIADFANRGLGVLCGKKLFPTTKLKSLKQLISEKLHYVGCPEAQGWKIAIASINGTKDEIESAIAEKALPVPLAKLIDMHEFPAIEEYCFFLQIDDFISIIKKWVKNYQVILESLISIEISEEEASIVAEHEAQYTKDYTCYYNHILFDFNQRIFLFGHDNTGAKEWRLTENEIKPYNGKRIFMNSSTSIWEELERHIQEETEFDFLHISFDAPDKAKSVINTYWKALGKFAKSNGFIIDEFSDKKLFITDGIKKTNCGNIQVNRNKINKIASGIYSIQLTCKKIKEEIDL